MSSSSGVELMIGLGALLAGRPHTRPIRITGTATTPELCTRFGLQPPRYEGPTGIMGVIADACRHEDLDAITLWGWVPHYLRDGQSPMTSLALLQRLSAMTDVTIDLSEMEGRARVHDER